MQIKKVDRALNGGYRAAGSDSHLLISMLVLVVLAVRRRYWCSGSGNRNRSCYLLISMLVLVALIPVTRGSDVLTAPVVLIPVTRVSDMMGGRG